MPLIHRSYRHVRLAFLAGLAGITAVISPQYIPAQSLQRTGTSYVLFRAGSQSTTMSGSSDDWRRARSFRAGNEGLLYFRQRGIAYVIRDPAFLRNAESLFGPQDALGARQSELGSRQTHLGREQARLGTEQARLGSLQANASPDRADELARQQDDLSRHQDGLSRQQDALSRQQDALSREQDGLIRIAEAKLQDLLADAVRSGLARRVD